MDRNETADNARRDPSLIVTLAVWNIDDSTEEDQRVLLADLVCAAWPTLTAQAQ